jgi:hypothetical protein
MMEKQFFRLTTKALKQMAYQLAIKNKLSHPFLQGKQSVGKKWMKLLMKRHPELSLKKLKAAPAARVKGFNHKNVSVLFLVLETKVEKVFSKQAFQHG